MWTRLEAFVWPAGKLPENSRIAYRGESGLVQSDRARAPIRRRAGAGADAGWSGAGPVLVIRLTERMDGVRFMTRDPRP